MAAKTTRVLIGYASRFGSTRDIAKRIAGNLHMLGSGVDVDVRSVGEIANVDRYDAVVFGSGVYDGSWTAEATDFVRRHAAILVRKPVWMFSVGSFGDQHAIVGGLMKKEPKEISEFEQTVHPRDYRVFAGVIDLDHWPAWGRLLFRALGGHAGDNRRGGASCTAFPGRNAAMFVGLWSATPTARHESPGRRFAACLPDFRRTEAESDVIPAI
jgi:menaquinone-dependent protoporphyrinogen oxidase